MGLRQPSKISVFGTAAAQGAERQKEAREKLKQTNQTNTGQVLGGQAAASTAMVAAGTQAQKESTRNVYDTAKNFVSQYKPNLTLPTADVGSMISSAQQLSSGPTAASQPTGGKTAGGNAVWSSLTGPATGLEHDVSGLTNQEAAFRKDAETIQSTLTALDNINEQIRASNVKDQEKLNREKTRLEEVLKSYVDKIEGEKLGQIGTKSQSEINAESAQRLLSEGKAGGEVGKLKAIFGKRNVGKFGGLAGQIYGKDLELMENIARSNIAESEKEKLLRDTALGQYKGQLEDKRSDLTKTLEDRKKAMEITELGLQGARDKGYTDDEIIRLMGDKLGQFFNTTKENGKIKLVSDKVGFIKGLYQTQKDKALQNAEEAKRRKDEATGKLAGEAEAKGRQLLGNVDPYTLESSGGYWHEIKKSINGTSITSKGGPGLAYWEKQRQNMDEWLNDKWTANYSGISKDSSIIDSQLRLARDFSAALDRKYNEIKSASDSKNYSALRKLESDLQDIRTEYNRRRKSIGMPDWEIAGAGRRSQYRNRNDFI